MTYTEDVMTQSNVTTCFMKALKVGVFLEYVVLKACLGTVKELMFTQRLSVYPGSVGF